MSWLSKKSVIVICLAATVLISGCAVHPLPRDISRETTISIIHNIRCEVKNAIVEKVDGLLKSSRSPVVRSMRPHTVVHNLNKIWRHDQYVAAKISTYQLTAIAYIFEFLITENNNESASFSFLKPFGSSNTQATLGLGGGITKQRIGKRNIEVVETFQELEKLNCKGSYHRNTNLLYPVTGSIGMGEIIDTFFRLSESGAGGKLPTSLRPSFPNARFVDKLTFTTTVSAGVRPKITLAAVPANFRLVEASGNFSASRIDQHDVTITIELPVTKKGLRPTAKALRMQSKEIVRATKNKAAEELCIQRALNREEQTGNTSLVAPEDYCRSERGEKRRSRRHDPERDY